MPNDYEFSGIRHYTPIQTFELGLASGLGSGRDMVNLHNGNHILEFDDFSLPFFNSPLLLKRYYNNLCDVVGMFGEGWHCIWEMKMSDDGDDRIFVDQTGAEWTFTYNAGSYDRPAGLFAELTVNGSTYTITNLRDKSVIVFEKKTDYTLSYVQNAIGVKHSIPKIEEGKIHHIETTHTGGGVSGKRRFEFTYTGDLVTSVKETSENREITFEYDANDRLIKVTLPNGEFCEFTYDGTYKLTSFKDYNNNVTQYEYDGSNRLSKRIGACGQEHSFTYNANQTVVNDPRGEDWTHSFNPNNGFRVDTTTPNGNSYAWEYNGDLLVTVYYIPNGIQAIRNNYDSDGFIQWTKDALNRQYNFTWDGNDLLTTITDPASNTITFTYNADRQVLTVTNQESEVTEYTYSSLGALEKITDPKDFETLIENNGYGQPTKVTDPLGFKVQTTYDSGSIVPVSVVGKDGKTTSYEYDELKRILEKVFPNGDKLEYSWDGSRLCEIVKRTYSNGETSEIVDFVRYSHDGVNRAVTVETMDGGNTRYDFNANGQVKSVHSRDCQPREYTYDEDGNLTKVRINDDTNKEYDFDVDDRGWRTKITYPNGWYIEYNHNDAGQITVLYVKDSQDAVKHLIGYSYNDLSLISQEDARDLVAGWTIEKIISRDDVGRVSEEDRNTTEGTYGTDYDLEYTYDANGNLTRIHNTDGGGEDINMELDALNRLVRYYDATAAEKGIFSYNCAGLLAAREVDGDITKFGYDVHNVLDLITKANGDELGFDFDMLGRLRRYDTDTRESTFNYDGTKRFGDFDGGWKRYHWCKSQFLGYEDDANTYYIVPDIHGSTKVIFTHAGTIVNRLDYDTLGKIRNQDTTPQVELLWRGINYNFDFNSYVTSHNVYDPVIGMIFFIYHKVTKIFKPKRSRTKDQPCNPVDIPTPCTRDVCGSWDTGGDDCGSSDVGCGTSDDIPLCEVIDIPCRSIDLPCASLDSGCRWPDCGDCGSGNPGDNDACCNGALDLFHSGDHMTCSLGSEPSDRCDAPHGGGPIVSEAIKELFDRVKPW